MSEKAFPEKQTKQGPTGDTRELLNTKVVHCPHECTESSHIAETRKVKTNYHEDA